MATKVVLKLPWQYKMFLEECISLTCKSDELHSPHVLSKIRCHLLPSITVGHHPGYGTESLSSMVVAGSLHAPL